MKKQPQVQKTETRKIHKTLKGRVVSDKMNETATIKVISLKKHPIYKKRYNRFKKYLAHNKGNQFKLGDEVVIEETRPLSKHKRWIIKSKVKQLAKKA